MCWNITSRRPSIAHSREPLNCHKNYLRFAFPYIPLLTSTPYVLPVPSTAFRARLIEPLIHSDSGNPTLLS